MGRRGERMEPESEKGERGRGEGRERRGRKGGRGMGERDGARE